MKAQNHGGGRWFVLLLTLAVALSAPLISLRFIALFVFLLTSIALLYAAIVPRRVEVRRLDPDVRGTRLESIPVRILLRNGVPIPVARIIASERPNRLFCDQPHREATLGRWGEEVWTMTIRSERRGEFHYGPLLLQGSDPFGFFSWQRSDSSTGRAVVYPRIYSISLANREGVAGGEIRSTNPAHEDVSRFRSLREYVSGDEPKRINWKASAKTGRLFTTEYERALTVGVRIVLNLSADDYPSRRRDQSIERAVEIAAALVFSYTRLGQPVGLTVGTDDRTPVVFREESGWAHAERILEQLARVEAEKGSADFRRLVLAGGRRLGFDLRLIIICPTPNVTQVDELRALRAGRLRLELIEIPTAAERSATDAEKGRNEAGVESKLEGFLRIYRATETGGVLLERW